MKGTLEKLFKRVFVASNGQEAYELYKHNEIDIVITDINMPIMSGSELIKQIQEYSEYEPMIIVLSAHNESRLLTSLINIGINFFVNKPLDKQVLLNILFKASRIISERKLLVEYENKLQQELEAMERKNRILEYKLNQLAYQTNQNIRQEHSNGSAAPKNENLHTYDYYDNILSEDKEELQDLAGELDNFIAMMFQGERLDTNYIPKLSQVYRKYASILNTYPEFGELASYLHNFSEVILGLESKFMQDIEQTGIYLESLQLSLETFRQNVWNKKAKDPRFYNASLKTDIEMVINFLEGKESAENEIEFF